MCGPAGIALVAAGAVASTISAVKGAQAQKSQANYTAAVDQQNAGIANNAAMATEQQAADQETQQRRNTALELGKQRALMGGSGIDSQSGSSLSLIGDTAATGELDALTVRNNGQWAAYNKQLQGASYSADAGLETAKADDISPLLVGGTAALTGAGQVASSWYGTGSGGLSSSTAKFPWQS